MRRIGFILMIAMLGLPAAVFAQAAGGLRGKVTDPSGAVVPGASVRAVAADGQARAASTNSFGEYEFQGMAPGRYTVAATAKGFAGGQSSVDVPSGYSQRLDITLEIQVEKERIEVDDQSQGVDTSSSNNAGAIVIKGKDLDALSDDPDDLQSELEALAGPSAGPNGGQIYIDGFTGGQLPPKSSIREIRINQNPFSAEYDKLGYGRIEIFTKPGTDKVHGRFMANGNTSALNTGNPFVRSQPGYYSTFFMGNVGGPLSKTSSYNISMFRREIQSNAIVNATVLKDPANPIVSSDPRNDVTSFTTAVTSPRSRLDFSPRFDFQLTPDDTLTARYSYHRTRDTNSGIGQFSLPSMAYNAASEEHEIQLSETHIVNPRVINETRFEYSHENTTQTPLNTAAAILVRGAFSEGGNQQGNSKDLQNYFEVQNYTSIVSGTHMFKFGARLRDTDDVSTTNAGFNGTFTYDSVYSYLLTESALAQGITSGPAIRSQCIPDPSGRIDPATGQTLQICGGPSQFSITTGNPEASINLLDAGLFFQDEWKMRPNLTLSYGLRFETQNHFADHINFAPRVAIAWGLGSNNKGPAKTVLRAGYGWFYDRLPYSSVLMQDRQLEGSGGLQQFIVENPDFLAASGFDPSSASVSANAARTVYLNNPNLRAPYTMQAAASVEHAWTKAITTSLTYLNSRGLHQFLTANINAPVTLNLADCAAGRPDPVCQNIYQFQSEGIFKQNQMIANFRVNGKVASLFGFYSLSFANGSTSGIGYFPSDPYNWMADYGRASFDVRNRFLLGGNINLPYGFSVAPFMVVNSGQPYNITLGQDLNGDSQFNDRPWYAAGITPSCTNPDTFSRSASGGARIPVNYCTGPAEFDLNLRLSKTIGFGPQTEKAAQGGGPGGGPHGPRGGGAPGGGLGPGGLTGGGGMGPGFGSATNRRYALTFTLMAHNLFNVVNYGPPVGVLSSPQFGESISLAGGMFGSGSANRSINLQMMFTF